MSNLSDSITRELRLLLASAAVFPSEEGEVAIQQALNGDIDWTLFARKAMDHGLAGLAGHTLARIAPDAVPEDILNALRIVIDRTRTANRALFEELVGVIAALTKEGVEVIPFKGPVLAILSYGDLGLRVFGDLDFLIRDVDLPSTIGVLHTLGYQRSQKLTAAQLDLIHRLQGQDIIFKEVTGIAVEPHTRLIPIKMALDIDYPGLWSRARRRDLNGHSMLTLAPEDEALALAIHGGKELWWNIKWACDFAVFIGSHPQLDWPVVIERARVQGCLRMLLLATSLARRYLYANLPPIIVTAERADTVIDGMISRIVTHWEADKPVGPPSNKTVSIDRLRLHDGPIRQARYALRTMFLPGVHHVASIPVPRNVSFVYVPIKIAHDFLALPLWRASAQALKQTMHWQDLVIGSGLPLAVIPISAEAKLNIKRHRAARAEARRALAKDPNDAMAWSTLGDALSGLKRYKEAIVCYNSSLAIEPDNPSYWRKRRTASVATGEMLEHADFLIDPQSAKAWALRAGYFLDSKHLLEAIEASEHALALNPENVPVTRLGINARLFACDWHKRQEDESRISDGIKARSRMIAPVFHRAICNSEAEHLMLTQLWAKGFLPLPQPLWRGETYRHDKIRIAYVSTDFRDHVVADAMAGCFEHHDKTRFETTAVSLHPSDGSKMRRRIEAAFDRYVDVETLSNTEAAVMLRKLEIDIVIDLNGHSGAKRIGIFTRRPAPVQVNYLGYPGTLGGNFMDYIIADQIVIPDENRVHYSEQVAYLPHTYFPNDRTRRIGKNPPSRAEAGLPEIGFVFACHNAAHKIGPEVFEIWMRLLRSVEGSVLWLKSMDPAAMGNLWRAARTRGIAPERLVFAPRLPHTADHLARLHLADLFLDTLPYNAHATASDALWAGLPVVTCAGNTFPGRVAASLLHAVGLPELVTASLAEYEELARTLAQDPVRLAAIRAKLKRNRETEPLFDTARFTRDLEAAYTTMWERQQAGLPPATFAVPERGILNHQEE